MNFVEQRTMSRWMSDEEWWALVPNQMCREPGCPNRIEGPDDFDDEDGGRCELFCCEHREI
jgi:hypothetical protein